MKNQLGIHFFTKNNLVIVILVKYILITLNFSKYICEKI
jgi:hypothetical protein